MSIIVDMDLIRELEDEYGSLTLTPHSDKRLRKVRHLAGVPRYNRNLEAGYSYADWSPELCEYIAKYGKVKTNIELVEMINGKFGIEIERERISNFKNKYGIRIKRD
ncbi:MAG: hypothetical protein L0J35_06475 [Tetragenococcus halophilus]|nr:hypothetical protein [Tetragenococcus halophilus]